MRTNEEDYYAILNIPREATAEEIRAAYKKLAITYHPDRQEYAAAVATKNGTTFHNQLIIEEAKEKFTLIKRAYETLIDEQRRIMYDRFPPKQKPNTSTTTSTDQFQRPSISKTFDTNQLHSKNLHRTQSAPSFPQTNSPRKWAVSLYRASHTATTDSTDNSSTEDRPRHNASTQGADKRHMHDAASSLSQKIIGTTAKKSVNVESFATMLPNRDLYDNKPAQAAMYQAYLVSPRDVVVAGSFFQSPFHQQHNPSSVFVGLQRNHSSTSNTFIKLLADDCGRSALEFGYWFPFLTPRCRALVNFGLIHGQGAGIAGCNWTPKMAFALENLDSQVRAFVKINGPASTPAMSFADIGNLHIGVEKQNTSVSWKASLQAGFQKLGCSVEVAKELSKRTKVKIRAWLNMLDSNGNWAHDTKLADKSAISIGGRRKISGNTKFGVYFNFHLDSLSMSVRFSRSLGQRIDIPVMIVPHNAFSLKVLLGTLFVPSLVISLAKIFWIEPRKKLKKRRKIEQLRKENAELTAAARKSAQSAIHLMLNTVARIRAREQAKDGLIIVQALYGNLEEEERRKQDGKIKQIDEEPVVIDVTIPLQYLVEESKLHLYENSKASLMGFYDPCIGEDKQLYIRYLFHSYIHEVIVDDCERLRIPLASHRIDAKKSK